MTKKYKYTKKEVLRCEHLTCVKLQSVSDVTQIHLLVKSFSKTVKRIYSICIRLLTILLFVVFKAYCTRNLKLYDTCEQDHLNVDRPQSIKKEDMAVKM